MRACITQTKWPPALRIHFSSSPLLTALLRRLIVDDSRYNNVTTNRIVLFYTC